MVRQTYTVWLLLDSSGLGGIETHVTELAKSLRNRNHEVTICFLKRHNDHPLLPMLDESDIPYMFLTGSWLNLYRKLRNTSPDILHTHGYKAGIFGRLAAKLTPTRCISTYHAGEPGSGLVAIYSWLDRATALLSNGVIAVSQTVASQLPQKTHVIQNFIALPEPNPKQSQEDKHIAFVGRLSHEKGPDLLLNIAAKALDFNFHLYGDGPLLDSLAATQTNADNVTFHGRQNMEEYWHSIDVLLITSRHEALPLVTIEAMARGIPVIAPAIGALPELVTDNETGWICSPSSPEQVVKALETWQSLSEQQLRKLQQNCIALITANYSEQAVIPHIEAIYNKG